MGIRTVGQARDPVLHRGVDIGDVRRDDAAELLLDALEHLDVGVVRVAVRSDARAEHLDDVGGDLSGILATIARVFSTAHDVSIFAQGLLDRRAGRPSEFPLT